jgi:hypothetical protein
VIRTTWRQMKFRPHELRRVLIELLAPAGGPNLIGQPLPRPAYPAG